MSTNATRLVQPVWPGNGQLAAAPPPPTIMPAANTLVGSDPNLKTGPPLSPGPTAARPAGASARARASTSTPLAGLPSGGKTIAKLLMLRVLMLQCWPVAAPDVQTKKPGKFEVGPATARLAELA